MSVDYLLRRLQATTAAEEEIEENVRDGNSQRNFIEYILPRLFQGHTLCLCLLFAFYCLLFFFWLFGLLDEALEYAIYAYHRFTARISRFFGCDKDRGSYEAEAAPFTHEPESRPAYCDPYKATLNRKQAETFAKTGGLSKADKRRGFEIAVTATGPHVVKKWLKNAEIHGVPRKQGDVKVT